MATHQNYTKMHGPKNIKFSSSYLAKISVSNFRVRVTLTDEHRQTRSKRCHGAISFTTHFTLTGVESNADRRADSTET
jgi:hypothetical protein